MPNLLEERVRRALKSTIRIDAEVGGGGMGVVYRGWHSQFERDVAVKVLRLEFGDADAIERFRQEAQVMVRLRHRHIIRVLDFPPPDQVDGLSLFTMEFLAGESLAQRVERKRLLEKEAYALGLQLLDALIEVHRHGVIHRDVKPGNVVYDQERGHWVLADFGIAKVPQGPASTEPGTARGTREYMPPNKDEWREATVQSDLYAAAATIYEAYTAEPWNPNTSPTSAGWSQIPRHQAAALRKGTASDARERWKSAQEFLDAFRVRRPPGYWAAIATAVSAGIIAIIGNYIVTHRIPFALAGVSTTDPALQAIAGDINRAVMTDLSAVLDTDPVTIGDCRHPSFFHRPIRCADGLLVGLPPDSLKVSLGFYSGGKGQVVDMGPERDKDTLAGRLAIELLGLTGHPTVTDDCSLSATPTTNAFLACRKYLDGSDLLNAGSWTDAASDFEQAIDLNPALADAIWLLYFTQGWRREPIDPGLVAKIHAHLEQLSEMHRLLFDAQTTPLGQDRIAKFERVIRRYQNRAFPSLLYGSELFHRGPLLGIPLDSCAAVLRRAVAADTTLTEAYDQLIWVLIRLGNQRATDSTLAAYPPDHRGALYMTLAVARDARFDTVRFKREIAQFADADTALQRSLRQTFRFGLSLELPVAEGMLGQIFVKAPDPGSHSDGFEGWAIAQLYQGQIASGIAHVDSASMGDDGALEAAEWRVIFPALRIFNVPDSVRQRGRETLRAFARTPGGLGARAAWASAIDAYLTGDDRGAATWEAILRSQAVRDTVARLSALLAAVKVGVKGSYRDALRLSRGSLQFDESPQVVDPFWRTCLHLLRARWAQAAGDAATARRERLWSDNADIQGWSTGPAQASEVDWVARGNHAGVP